MYCRGELDILLFMQKSLIILRVHYDNIIVIQKIKHEFLKYFCRHRLRATDDEKCKKVSDRILTDVLLMISGVRCTILTADILV